MIQVPAFPQDVEVTFVHRDEAILSSAAGHVTVNGPWCGELTARIDGRSTRFELVSRTGGAADRLAVLGALLRLEEHGLIVEAPPPAPLDPSIFDFPAQTRLEDDSRLLRLADSRSGLIAQLHRRQSAIEFLHVLWTEQPMPEASQISGDVLRAAIGTGTSEREAVTSCIGEAVERYCLCFHGYEKVTRARAEQLDAPSIPPSSLLLMSERQYREREAFNRTGGELWLPACPDDAQSRDWLPVWSLTAQEKWYLPAASVLIRYPPESPESFGADSNGCAAGRSLEEAAVRGFCELVERDAIALWWYNRIPRPALDVAVAAEFGERLSRCLREAGRTLHLLDLTTDIGIPVVAAISARNDGAGVAFGFGAGLRTAAAARRALLEMQQVLGAIDAMEPGIWLDRWSSTVSLGSDPWLAPAPGAQTLSRDAAVDGRSPLETCLEIARARGFNVLAANLTRPGIDIPVVRIVIPGLRPAFPRFAPGRLYDVPCALGWRTHPAAEQDLNPFPFFL